MADTGAILPGLGSSEDFNPTVAAWSNPTYIQTDAGLTYASRSIPLYEYTDYLRASQFGFAIPAGTVDSVKVEFNRKASAANVVAPDYLYLVDDGGGNGANKADPVNYWPVTAATATYQGDSTYWGVTLTPALVNNSNFGIRLVAGNYDEAAARTAYVDWVKITVYYTEAPTFQPFRNYYPHILAH